MEELKRISCSEAEKTRKLVDDLSRQELQENRTTMNQFPVQTEESQDKVNPVNDSRDCQILRQHARSGLSHVPDHLFIDPSSFAKLCRDSSP